MQSLHTQICNLLATATSESNRKAVTAALCCCLIDLNEPALLPPSIPLYWDVLAYCHWNLEDLPSPGLTSAVLDNALHSKSCMEIVISSFSLWDLTGRWKHSTISALQQLLPSHKFLLHSEPNLIYPPLNSLVAELPEIYTLWEHSFKFGKQPDKQQGWPNILLLKKLLVSRIGPGQVHFLVDEEGHLCGIVWLDFVLQPSVLDDLVASYWEGKCWEEDKYQGVTNFFCAIFYWTVSLQKVDPGLIQIAGYSAGSCSNPQFDWIKNLAAKRYQ